MSEFEELTLLHNRAIDGDKEAAKKAYDIARKIFENNPGNPLAIAYMGSTTALLGRDAIDPEQRFKLALEGMKYLDSAVSREPDNTEIRILRGYVAFKLPETFFHRTSTAIEDFTCLIRQYQKNKAVFRDELFWQLLYDLGTAYRTIGDIPESDRVWNELAAVTSSPKYLSLLGKSGSSTPNQSDSGFKKKIAEGAELHCRAFSEGKEAVKKALDFFEKMYAEHPEDPLTAAYYADCMSMYGKQSGDSAMLFANAIKAVKILDQAANRAPDSVEIRLIRADQSLRLPEAFFKRTATAITDLEYLIERYRKDDSVFSRELYNTIYFLLGKAYLRLDMQDEAKSAWEKLLSMNKEPGYRKLVMSELNKLQPVDIPYRQNIGSDKRDLLREGIRLHDMAVAGNRKASKAAFEVLQKAFETDPGDPIVEGYYGSSMALMARDSSDTTIMFTNAIKGLQHIKHAVSKAYGNIDLRLLRAYLTYNMPEFFFHMSSKAAKDFKYLKTAYEQNNGIFSKELYWQILYDLGVCYRNSGDTDNAEKVWSKLLKECPDTKYKALIQNGEGRGIQ